MKNNNNYMQILKTMEVEEDISQKEKSYLENEKDIETLKARLFILKGLQEDGLIPKNQVKAVEERIKELQGLTVQGDKAKQIKENVPATLGMQRVIQEMDKIDDETVKYTPKEYVEVTKLHFHAKPGLNSFAELAGYLVWDYYGGNIYIWHPTGNMKTHPNGEWYVPIKVIRNDQDYYNYCVTCYGPVEHEIK